MREEFISYLWQYKLLANKDLRTTEGQILEILNPGTRNYNSGPDFIASKILIEKTIWAGNVEIHIKTSDWKTHNHHKDPAYSNIILHVVYENDITTDDKKAYPLPCIELKNYINYDLFKNFQKLINQKTWIPCQYSICDVKQIVVVNWLNRVLIERLERRSSEILHFLKYNKYDWEETFYYFLAKNFGFKKNQTPFGLVAQKTPLSVLKKHKNHLFQIEALLFGQAGFITPDLNDVYPKSLYAEYCFLKQKYNLNSIDKKLWKHSKLRPANFPCIRISQLAMLINKTDKLFQDIISCSTINQIISIFDLECSPYWSEHYIFDKSSVIKSKVMGQDSIYNLIINTIVPFLFIYGKERMQKSLIDKAFEFLSLIPSEKNQVINKWNSAGIKSISAADSQSLLELRKYYCISRKCLDCSIGHQLIIK